MRNCSVLASLIVLAVLLGGCTTAHHGNIAPGIVPQWSLDVTDFKVVRTVRGSAKSSYFFGMGDSPQDLYNIAYAAMIGEADMDGQRRLLMNIGNEVARTGAFPLFYTKSVTVWATVVEIIRKTPSPAEDQ